MKNCFFNAACLFSFGKRILHEIAKRRCVLKLLLAAVVMVCTVTFAFADYHNEEDDDDEEIGWQIMLGGGVMYDQTYIGSNKHEFLPMPFFDIRYSIDSFSFFASMEEGLGIEFEEEITELFVQIGANLGEGREPGDDKTLSGTPKIKNWFMLFGELSYELPIGSFGITTEYYRANVDYKSSVSRDHVYNGFLYGPMYSFEYFVTNNLALELEVELQFMNNDYADTYHSVKYQTARLKKYNAGAGLHSVGAELDCYWFFTEHIGIGLNSGIEYLLGDAKNSPLTKSPLQIETGLIVVYKI